MAIKLLNNFDFSISEEDSIYLKNETKKFLLLLKQAIKKSKIKAEPFVGGSFAKDTMTQSDNYDVDIFIRFDKKYTEEQLSKSLEKIAKNLGVKSNNLHGSRDYLQVEKSQKLTFEIIPVIKISKPKEAKNTTDLSYFHVNYVKKKLKNKNISREIRIAKKFFKANRVYGAESYISGFSGYAVECLLIYYKSFEKMIKSFLTDKKIVIDVENQYKKSNILIEINEAKTHSPIIFVDPTYKERNVLAALTSETFEKTQEVIEQFLAKPSAKFFETKPVDEIELINEARQTKGEFVKVVISTDKQAGDIAGTKLKKFSRHLLSEIREYFDVIKDEFDYKLTKEATLYLILRKKKEVIKRGPPIRKGMEKNIDAFKKNNKDYYAEDNNLFAKVAINFTAKEFIKNFAKKYSDKLKEMDVIEMRVN